MSLLWPAIRARGDLERVRAAITRMQANLRGQARITHLSIPVGVFCRLESMWGCLGWPTTLRPKGSVCTTYRAVMIECVWVMPETAYQSMLADRRIARTLRSAEIWRIDRHIERIDSLLRQPRTRP